MRRYIFVILLLLLSFFLLLTLHLIVFTDKRLHIVFCDVGQGDAVLLRSPSGVVFLVDAGPDESVEDCLAAHLPFWERTLTMMLLTHPHADHYVGMLGVLDRYRVLGFATEKLQNDTVLFRALSARLVEKGVAIRMLYKGDVLRLSDGVVVRVLGPSNAYLQKTSPGGRIGERSEFASLVLRVEYGDFALLLTGDSQVGGIEEALVGVNNPAIDVLHVPHHGSKTGLNASVLERLRPDLAVISVGKNSYGHPSSVITDLLRRRGIMTLETYKDGEVEIVTDGQSIEVK